jgi:MFS transporter, PPP family, 3-phenylpropionic acid transporter
VSLDSQAPLPYWRLSGLYFSYFALVGVLVPFWSLYLQALGFSGYDIGLLSAMLMLTRMLAPNFWGWLADRRGNRMGWIRLGSLLALVSFAGIYLSKDFYWLLWVVFAFSFFWNAVLPQTEVVTLEHLYPHTGRYSLVRQWGSVGFFITVVCLGYWFEGARILSLPLIASACLLCIWLASLLVPNAPAKVSIKPSRPLAQLVRKKSVLLFLLAAFLVQVSHGAYYTFYSIYLNLAGYSASTMGWLWALGVLAEIALFWVMHRLLARFAMASLLLVGVVLSVLRWCLMAAYVEWLWILIVAQLLHAASFGLTHALAIEWVRRAFAGADGQGQALYSSLCFGAGGAVGAWVSGVLWDTSAAATFWLAGAIAVLAVVPALYLYRRGLLDSEMDE